MLPETMPYRTVPPHEGCSKPLVLPLSATLELRKRLQIEGCGLPPSGLQDFEGGEERISKKSPLRGQNCLCNYLPMVGSKSWNMKIESLVMVFLLF